MGNIENSTKKHPNPNLLDLLLQLEPLELEGVAALLGVPVERTDIFILAAKQTPIDPKKTLENPKKPNPLLLPILQAYLALNPLNRSRLSAFLRQALSTPRTRKRLLLFRYSQIPKNLWR